MHAGALNKQLSMAFFLKGFEQAFASLTGSRHGKMI